MKRNIFIVLFLIILAVGLQGVLSNQNLFENLELKTYDMRAKFATEFNIFFGKKIKADKNIVIVAIDDYSIKTLSKNPSLWEKNVWKNTLNFIERGKPKAVMFDMVFEKTVDEPWYDKSFAQELIKYDNIVLGTFLDEPLVKENNFSKNFQIEQNDSIATLLPLEVSIDDKKLEDTITYKTSSKMDSIYAKNNIIGVLNPVLDSDSIIRDAQPIFKLVKRDKTYYLPSMAFAGFLKYMGSVDKVIIKKNKLYYKDRVLPLDEDGVVKISRRNLSRSYDYVPISRILLNKSKGHDLSPKFFKDKIVIIGKPATGDYVDLSSIIDASYSSPEIVAAAIDNFINDSVLGKGSSRKILAEVSKPVQLIITVFACLVVVLLGLIPKSAFIGFLNGFLSIIAYIVFSFWMFVNPASRILMPIVVPLYYLAVTSGIVFALRFYQEMTRKASIMNVFGKFVSPKVLASVMKDPERVILKNTKKRITILFCDVKNFSSLCEQHDPETLVTHLNELFKEIVNIIFDNNGTVDKFIGDCIMAYWGDLTSSDEDSFMAVKTALEIKQKVSEIAQNRRKNGKIVFDIKIGINTGDAVLGLAGTDKIMSYTAMGDAVNVASRLETACNKLNKQILISKSTYDEIFDKIVALSVGEIEVKGKTEKIEVFEPVGLI